MAQPITCLFPLTVTGGPDVPGLIYPVRSIFLVPQLVLRAELPQEMPEERLGGWWVSLGSPIPRQTNWPGVIGRMAVRFLPFISHDKQRRSNPSVQLLRVS